VSGNSHFRPRAPAIAAPRRSRRYVALISAVIAACVELFRLVHAPWLDEFRLTLVGALLLGRIFSPWDILAYGVGIGLGMLLDFAASAIDSLLCGRARPP
jgi:hypothetical protein